MRDQGNQAYKVQERENHTDLPVGEILRRTRLQYNLSLTDVEGALRIRALQLGAIESGKLEQLPGRVYAIGFVRAYSEFLGLDGNKMVHLFKVQSVGNRNRPELSFPVPASESKLPNFFILGGSLAGLAAVIALFFTFNAPAPPMEIPPGPVAAVEDKVAHLPAEHTPLESALMAAMSPAAGIDPAAAIALPQGQAGAAVAQPGPTPIQAAPIQPAHPAAPAVSAAAPAQTAALSPAQEGRAYQPPKAAGPKIVLNVRSDVWIEIRDAEGKPLLSRILKPGEQYVVPSGEGLVMDTGNAGAFDVYVGGKKASPLGATGSVKRNISLAPQNLLAERAVSPPPRQRYYRD
jgi:cytoskeleton protein RodZ